MGLLVEGKWHDEWYDTKKTNGKFVREASSFRERIGQSNYIAEKNRYHLYISYACPWAHRTLIMRALKNLGDIISYSSVEPLMLQNGWKFGKKGDEITGAKYLHELYTKANPKYTGRVTVPVLWDTQQETIINNESADIIRIFNFAFNDFIDDNINFYPDDLKDEINKINDFVYTSINNGVYKAGFATTQIAYDEAVFALFEALDKIEHRLSKHRYLIGNIFTEADIRLFTTLIRFDPVYVSHFKCNIRRIYDYPNLWNYVKDIYQIPEVTKTVDFKQIKTHYFASHKHINPTGVIPHGPELDLNTHHNRNRFN